MLLPRSYYLQEDVVELARDLLGKVLVTQFDGIRTAGMIVETEAYRGATDKASHAYNNRRTKRTGVMYREGGVAYVYLCYGIHHLFNVITNVRDVPHAVLVRGVEPLEGIGLMLERRGKDAADRTLTGGPGALSQALGIKTHHTGMNLQSKIMHIEDRGIVIPGDECIASKRVGIDYAEEDKYKPWRFRVSGSKWTSPAK